MVPISRLPILLRRCMKPTLSLLLAASAFADIQVPEAQAKHAAVSRPAPTLSPLARQMKLAGHVEVAVSIDESGSVTDVKQMQGLPALANSVADAVKKW